MHVVSGDRAGHGPRGSLAVVSAVMLWRWPERECFHGNIAVRVSLNPATGQMASTAPAQCVDCGHLFEDEEWSGR